MAGTDTCLFVVIDPCQLFTREEWAALFETDAAKQDSLAAIKEAILVKFDIPRVRPDLVNIVSVSSDGGYSIEQLGEMVASGSAKVT